MNAIKRAISHENMHNNQQCQDFITVLISQPINMYMTRQVWCTPWMPRPTQAEVDELPQPFCK